VLPTSRQLGLLLACCLPLAAADLLPGLQVATPALLLIALATAGLDWRRTPPQAALRVQREIANRLSLGADNPVALEVENRTDRDWSLRLRDELPPIFRVSSVLLRGEAAAREKLRLVYSVNPPRRGDYQLGRVVLRCRGALGLVERQYAYPAERAVKVYPNLNLRHYDLMVRRGMLRDAGTRNARRFGQGTEFERLREYQRDDEYRRINWKATARRGQPVSSEYETERSQSVLLILDAGRLMGAVAEGLTKLDHALNTALVLAHAASLRGDRVGLLAYTDRVRAYQPPARGRHAFLAILEQLYRLEPEQTASDHARAFGYLSARNPHRALLVLFTDLADTEGGQALVAQLSRAAGRHLAVLVTLSDPALEMPASRLPADSQELYEKAVAQRLLAEREQVLRTLQHRGVLTLDRPANRLSADLVAAYLELKARGRL
jgi:uncharacterized protein (DUF58 family)